MIFIAIGLLATAVDGPPPYPRSLQCAGVTMAWSDLEAARASAGAQLARSDAEFWAFAAIDAARRDGGVRPPQVEAAMDQATREARARFEAGDAATAGILRECQELIPKAGRGIAPIG